MKQHYFVSATSDSHPRWVQAFDDALMIPAPPPVMDRDTVVWVHTSMSNWTDIVASAVRCEARAIVLTLGPRQPELIAALTAGARGYAHAWSSIDILQQIAKVVDNGGLWVGADFLNQLVSATAARLQDAAEDDHADDDLLSTLTDREREVALAVAAGASNKEVARQLDITERTVKAHLGVVFQKLGVRDRLHLALQLKNTHPVL
ncbi:response regulator transcription factor [Salinispirillum sp. LH 10-3-1]|uniref:Response regulator transcription factor n=1 Tax=Salinispirillum sp. LH 10-3-1 TaxID=2952525 RepID=A0AB38YI66_9GAMM